MTAGEKLRSLRERLGLSIRMVESASEKLSVKYDNPDYFISLSRLSDIETKGVIPSIYRIYSLSLIYRTSYRQILEMFGIKFENVPADLSLFDTPNSCKLGALDSQEQAEVPVALDPGFREESTTSIVRMIQQWGTVPLALLKKFVDRKYTYGYVGASDRTMFPLIMPGSFIQVDESKTQVQEGGWRSEYERPVYFIETREGFTCCWCETNASTLILKPHPMSPARTRMLRLGSEAEVLGQVVGVAMRLDATEASGKNATP